MAGAFFDSICLLLLYQQHLFRGVVIAGLDSVEVNAGGYLAARHVIAVPGNGFVTGGLMLIHQS